MKEEYKKRIKKETEDRHTKIKDKEDELMTVLLDYEKVLTQELAEIRFSLAMVRRQIERAKKL